MGRQTRALGATGGTKHLCDMGTEAKRRDVVYTPDAVAAAIVQRYKPRGRILDPCRGDGAFWRHMPGAAWCEIAEGRDFFDWREPVDWVVGNPPYSVMNRWLEHSFEVADNVVYLIPVAKVFGSLMRLRMIAEYGGVAEVWAPWTGRAIGFEFGWAVGAVHFKRGHAGGTVFDIVAPNAKVSGAGTASDGLPGYAGDNNGEKRC